MSMLKNSVSSSQIANEHSHKYIGELEETAKVLMLIAEIRSIRLHFSVRKKTLTFFRRH